MRFYDISGNGGVAESEAREELRNAFAARLGISEGDAEESVRAIVSDVRVRGDAAVLDYTRRWDCADAQTLRVSECDIVAARERIMETPLWEPMRLAVRRIRAFHEKQIPRSWFDTSTPGETLGQIIRPLQRVGLYAPGGTASYPSTVLMTAIVARVAGVPDIALATPPSRETGLPPDATLAAASLAGVREVYSVGGAQAIAAFAYGTESIARVDKICGPGNLYVNLAKKLVYGSVGVDLLAGPSEVAILADEFADAEIAAMDILTQAEHDPNGSVLVASPSGAFLETLNVALARQLQDTPRRKICAQVLTRNGFFVQTATLVQAAEIINSYAPEHLHVDVRDPWAVLGYIQNAGAILLGRSASAPLGDYMAGPSHTLPTAGCARWASPLNVEDFVKRTSLISLSSEAARALSPAAETFAEFEGLPSHARAARGCVEPDVTEQS